jgi:hypothetical protein
MTSAPELFAALETVREALLIGAPCVSSVRALLTQCQAVVDADAEDTKRLSQELLAAVFRPKSEPTP